jgi:hypothetical protein
MLNHPTTTKMRMIKRPTKPKTNATNEQRVKNKTVMLYYHIGFFMHLYTKAYK